MPAAPPAWRQASAFFTPSRSLLLIIVTASFYNALAGEVPDANAASALGLILLVSIVAILLGSPHYDLAWLMVAILLLIAFVPVIVAVVVSLWAATRPSAGARPPGTVPP